MACQKGHFAHTFLQCDVRSSCGQTASSPSCPVNELQNDSAASHPATTSHSSRVSLVKHGSFNLEQGMFSETSTASKALVEGSDFSATAENENEEQEARVDISSEPQEQSKSEQERRTGLGISVNQFACENGSAFVHYTLVCDFRPDCSDQSDESFYRHRPCKNKFTCSNGQCVPYPKRGDFVSDCTDDSDEVMDETYASYPNTVNFSTLAVTPPVIIHFNRDGFYKEKLGANESCPDTHYRCPGRFMVCLPVYTRCNGYFDC